MLPQESHLLHFDLLDCVSGDFCEQFEPIFNDFGLVCGRVVEDGLDEDLYKVDLKLIEGVDSVVADHK